LRFNRAIQGKPEMNLHRIILFCLLGIPLAAQPQIGGGTCTSSTLNGTYSITIAARDLGSTVTFSNVLQGGGLATFDGLSKVTFTLTNNTNKNFGVAQTWSGTYSLQSNCIGAVNITVGDTASFILGSFNQGQNYFMTGQDGVYSFIVNGNTQPTGTCAAGTLSGVYAFNGNGFALNSAVIAGVNYISGLLTFDGTSAVSSQWYVAAGGTSAPTLTTGTYTVSSNCTATATLTDSSSNAYVLTFVITTVNGPGLGTNFTFNGSNAKLMFSATGRIL
jgi:hypothetical protein